MSTNLSSVPKLQFFDANGNPLVGGKLFTYAAGTTTPLATYTDSTGVTPNTNPIILDSRGEANVWLDATQYKFELKTSTDALIWTVDNISNALNLSQLLASSGSAASPPYTFAADTTTGMFLAAAGQIGLSANGKPVLRSTDTTMIIGQSGGSDNVDLTLYGDLAQTGNVTLAGNMAFSGTGRRITGDFSNATIADRVMFQTSTVNEQTSIGVLPNGTGTVANINVFGGSGPNNTSLGQFVNTGTEISIRANLTGTGTYLPLTFYTGGSERVRVDTSGNVGIGTSSPSTLLHVQNTSTNAVARITSASANQALLQLTNTSSTEVNAQVACFPELNNNYGVLQFSTAGSGGLAERMRIDSSGNVGIGTSSPSFKLQVAGTQRIQKDGAGYEAAMLSFSTITETGGIYRLGMATGGAFVIGRADTNTTNITLDSSGNVGIGTNSPSIRMHIQNTTATTNAVTQILRIDSQSSGTPANGIGVGMEFATETAAGNTEIGATIEAITTDVTSTSEDFDLSFKTMTAGAAASEKARLTSTGLFQFNSGYGSVATAYGCRAWINFDGTSGSIGTGRGSGNVSSVTDNGTGDYTINFTTAMPDANYSVQANVNLSGNGQSANVANAISTATGSVQIQTWWANFSSGGQFDPTIVSVAIFR